MVSALQQQLIPAPLNGLPDFLSVRIHVCDIGFSMARYAVEITEFAVGDTNVGGIDIAVDLPAYLAMWHLFFPERICNMHQFRQGCLPEQE